MSILHLRLRPYTDSGPLKIAFQLDHDHGIRNRVKINGDGTVSLKLYDPPRNYRHIVEEHGQLVQ